LDGKIWALKANSLTSPLIVTVTVNTNCGLFLEIMFNKDKQNKHMFHRAGVSPAISYVV